jgi:hypothetical protein
VVEATGVVAFEDAPQTEAATTEAKVGLILSNLLILSLYGFPLSIAEGWALADPTKAKKQPKTESPELLEAVETSGEPTPTIGDEVPASSDDWTALLECLPHWVQKPQAVPARLVAGCCLTVVMVVVEQQLSRSTTNSAANQRGSARYYLGLPIGFPSHYLVWSPMCLSKSSIRKTGV